MKNPILPLSGLVLAAGVGYALFVWVQPEAVDVVRSTAKPSASPVGKLTMEKGTVRSAKTLNLSRGEDITTEVTEKDLVRQSKPVAELDAKFATWRDDGRKAVEDMFGGDRQKIGDAFRAGMANEEFRANFGRMRELESQYRAASDDQKQGIMDELATIRTRGLNMLKQAAAGAPANNEPTVTVSGGVLTAPGTVPPPPPPAAAPAAPVRFE